MRLPIKTQRLYIAEFDESMAESVHRNSLDEDNRRFVPDEVFETIQDAQEVITTLISYYSRDDMPLVYPFFLNDGPHIGHVQVVPIEKGWEIGYHVAKSYTGKGYATEAVLAFLPPIMRRLGITEISGICRADNTASRRVLEKCGFTLKVESAAPYHGETHRICRYIKQNEELHALQSWGMSGAVVTPIDSPSQTTWDVDGQYVLKRYRSADDLSRSLRFSNLLAQEGISVAANVPTSGGQPSADLYCLMTKLPGKHGNVYENPSLAAVMGRELARLHIALVRIEENLKCHDNDLLSSLRNSFKPCLGSVPEMAEHIEAIFDEFYPKLPRQPIHRDVHFGNVLFENGFLTGWLDFDIGQKDARLFDIAYLLSGLLVGNIHDTAKIETWRLIYRTLLSEYDAVNPLTADEREVLPVFIIVIEFLFVWFYTQQGSAEHSSHALELAQWMYDEYRMGS